MKTKLVFCGTAFLNDEVNMYCDSIGCLFVDPKPTGDENKPTKLYKCVGNIDGRPGDPVDFEYEIVDEHDYYTVDCDYYSIKDKKIYGDMAWHFNEGSELLGCDQYKGDDDFVSGFKYNCEYNRDEDDSIEIFTFYKQHGEKGDATLFHTFALCPKTVADKYGIKADSYLD